MDIQYIGADDWSNIQASFSTDAGGTMNYMMICVNKDPMTGMHNALYASVQGAFKLMPNIFIISHEKANFFSDKTTLQFLEKPAGATLSDFEPFFAFFKVIAFKVRWR